QPGAAPFEDPDPGLGVGLREQREPDVEALVLPRGGARRRQGLLQEFLALGRELVDDPRALAREGVRRGGLRVDPDDELTRDETLEGRVERAVREGAERTEQHVEPLAQLVAVHGRLLQQAEDGKLEDAGASTHGILQVTRTASRDSMYRTDTSRGYVESTLRRKRGCGRRTVHNS